MQNNNQCQGDERQKATRLKRLFLFFFTAATLYGTAQNEYSRWYFGDQTALSFMTNPPTVLNNSAMLAFRGCSSIADAAGNLLFYTNGTTVWNKQHAVMANGTLALSGSPNVANPMIIKQPGNANVYYIFREFAAPYITNFPIPPTTTGLYGSVVDMSLAGGMGSVTVNNVPIYTVPSYSSTTAQLHATRHNNGIDYWIMIHDYPANNFRAYLLTASGLSPSPVVSSLGLTYQNQVYGYLKFSPNGQKVCTSTNYAGVELFDFDNNTGQLSNPITLLSNVLENNYRGCEFSPDGSKLYAAHSIAGSTTSKLIQWDVNAGSNAAIISSSVNIPSAIPDPEGMQLAPNGKIYMASPGSLSLSVINNPNAAGIACNFAAGGQPISAVPNATPSPSSPFGLPNMITSLANTPCTTQTAVNPQVICAGSAYAIGNQLHTSAGTYIDTLQNVFGCNGLVIVNTQLTVTSLPNMNVIANPTVCVNDPLILLANGASSYTWNNSVTGMQYTSAPFTTAGIFTYTVQLRGGGSTGCVATNTVSVPVLVLACDVGLAEYNPSVHAKIYPNPANAFIQIELEERTLPVAHAYVYNLLGQQVKEEELVFKEGKAGINTAGLENGVYVLKLSSAHITTRFVVNR